MVKPVMNGVGDVNKLSEIYKSGFIVQNDDDA